MPNAPAQPGKLSANLLLDGAVRLAGQLSSLLDGRLQLDAVQTLDTRNTTATINIEAGAVATLSIPDTGLTQAPLEDATVRVARLGDNCITLEFASSDSGLAVRYREAIATGFRSGSGSAPGSGITTAVAGDIGTASSRITAAEPVTAREPGPSTVGSTAEYTRLLATLERQSLEELQDALTPFFSDLAGYILDISSRIKLRNSAANPHYDAAIILQRKSSRIAQHLLQSSKPSA